MKILYVTNSAKTGGVEKHVLQLVAGMKQRGHEVFLICPRGELIDEYLKTGATVRIDQPRFDIDPFYILRLAKYSAQENIQILHAHQLKTVVNALVAATLARVPVKIAHVHSPISGWPIPWYKKIPNLAVNYLAVNFLSTVAIALTAATKKERLKGERIRENKIRLIPNGIDIKKLKAQGSKLKTKENDSFLVGTLSRLSEEKGIEVFIRAIAEIPKEKRQNLAFVIAGEGPLRKRLEKLASELGVKDKIKFLGFVVEEEKSAFLRSLDLFVFPSLHEGFGYVLLEAMAAGVPTLSSDLEVLKELTCGGDFGYHFRRGDSHDLAYVLLRVLISLYEANLLAKKAAAWIENNYSLDKFILNYEKLYEELLAAETR